jgi:hypothetical protein
MSEHNQGDYGEAPHTTDAVAETLRQGNIDENGYLQDGTKPSLVQDVEIAHAAANASNEDRSLAAAHREQGKTYEGKYAYVDRARHEDVARAIGAAADLKEDAVIQQSTEYTQPDNPELLDNQERKRYEKLIEIRAEASKLHIAGSFDVVALRREMASIPPPNAYADYLFHGDVVESPENYDEKLLEPLKNVAYAQKFGAVQDRFAAEKTGVEMTLGWPDKYDRYRSELQNTVELNARNLFGDVSADGSKVEYAVNDSDGTELSDWTKNELVNFLSTLSDHTNSSYSIFKSPPSIVLGQNQEGKLVAKAYYVVQIGDRSSLDLESVELHDIDNILHIAQTRLQPVAAERAEGQRLASEIDPDAIKEEAAQNAEERNLQYIKDFKTNAPEFDDVTDDELYKLLRIAATSGDGSKYTTPDDLSAKDKYIVRAMRSKGILNVVTDSTDRIVDRVSIGSGSATYDKDFESWQIHGTNKVTKTRYKGSPWSFAFGRKIDKVEVAMTQEEIIAMRKRLLDLYLQEAE